MNKTIRIVLVDDHELVRYGLRRMLEQEKDMEILADYASAEEALPQIARFCPDIVLMNTQMPRMNGIEATRQLKKSGLPYAGDVIMLADCAEQQIEALEAGAAGFVLKNARCSELAQAIRNIHRSRQSFGESEGFIERTGASVEPLSTNTDRLLTFVCYLEERIKSASLGTIYRLSRVAEYKDPDTSTHIKRVGQYCASIARRLGQSDREVENILYAAPLHDVGKIGIPDLILLKPGKLTLEEWEIMKKHTIIGAQILEGSDTEFIRLAEVIALTHHEKWDGSGYPRGLRGSEIPLAGRITAIVDVFDALTSRRPYKEPFTVEKSLEIMKQEQASHFDPDVVGAFLGIKDEMASIKLKYRDEDQYQLAQLAHWCE